jgi:hypothetical protein
MKTLQKLETLLAIGLLIAFFLPWVSLGGLVKFSGYDIPDIARGVGQLGQIFTKKEVSQWQMALYNVVYLIPLLSISIVVLDILKKGTKAFSLALGVLPILLFTFAINRAGKSIFQGLSVGAYLTFILGIGLIFSATGFLALPATDGETAKSEPDKKSLFVITGGMVVLIAALLIGSYFGGVKNMVIQPETLSDIGVKATAELSTEDKKSLFDAVTRLGKDNINGKTVGQLISLQEKYENEKVEVGKFLKSQINITVKDKNIENTKGVYSFQDKEYITFKITIANTSNLDVDEIEASLDVNELLGDKLKTLNFKGNPVEKGKEITQVISYEYNQYSPDWQKIKNADMNKLDFTYQIEKIRFADYREILADSTLETIKKILDAPSTLRQWVNLNKPSDKIRALTVSGSTVFAGTDGGGAFVSTNNGTSWTAVNNGLTAQTVKALAVSGSTVFAGTQGGVYATTNNGTSWSYLGLRNAEIETLVVSGNRVYVVANDTVFVTTTNGAN